MFVFPVNNLPRWRHIRWLILLLSTLPGFATVQAASDDAQVVAEVVITLSLVNQTDMVFGDIASSNYRSLF